MGVGQGRNVQSRDDCDGVRGGTTKSCSRCMVRGRRGVGTDGGWGGTSDRMSSTDSVGFPVRTVPSRTSRFPVQGEWCPRCLRHLPQVRRPDVSRRGPGAPVIGSFPFVDLRPRVFGKDRVLLPPEPRVWVFTEGRTVRPTQCRRTGRRDPSLFPLPESGLTLVSSRVIDTSVRGIGTEPFPGSRLCR